MFLNYKTRLKLIKTNSDKKTGIFNIIIYFLFRTYKVFKYYLTEYQNYTNEYYL
jgi:hypothetical protein